MIHIFGQVMHNNLWRKTQGTDLGLSNEVGGGGREVKSRGGVLWVRTPLFGDPQISQSGKYIARLSTKLSFAQNPPSPYRNPGKAL